MCVGDLMTKGVATLNRNDTLATADNVMRLGRIRHMPVVDDDGTLVGLESQRDLFRGALLRALGYSRNVEDRVLDALAVKDAMSTDIVTALPDMPIREAARLMTERKIGCLVILEEDAPTGILTEGDLVALVGREDG